MVSNNDNLILKRAVDDADCVPNILVNVILFVDKVELKVGWRWTDVVVNTLVLQSDVSGPPLVDVLCSWTVAIERLENWQSISVGDRDSWDGWNEVGWIVACDVGVWKRWSANGGWVTWAKRKEGDTSTLNTGL